MDIFRDTSMVQQLLSPGEDELAGLESSIHSLRSDHGKKGSALQLAGALVSHSRPDYVEEGVKLLEVVIIQQMNDTAGTRPTTEQDQDLLISYYYLSIGQIKLDHWDQAKAVVNKMLQLDPANVQGQQLKNYMADEEHNRGVKGIMGTVAVVGAAAFAIGAMVFGRRR